LPQKAREPESSFLTSEFFIDGVGFTDCKIERNSDIAIWQILHKIKFLNVGDRQNRELMNRKRQELSSERVKRNLQTKIAPIIMPYNSELIGALTNNRKQIAAIMRVLTAKKNE